jgi:peptidyl-prolyl cis-trans isomerase SurA
MNSVSVYLLSFSLLVAASSLWAGSKSIDKVVAVVNKGVVMQSELDERINQVTANAKGNNLTLPDPKVLQKQVLDHLISEQLQLETAKRLGVKVTEDDVNRAIEQIRQNNKLTAEELLAQLKNDGMTIQALGEKIHRDLTIQHIQGGMVQQRIHISPLEIDNFLASSDAKFWVSPEYHLGHILINLPQTASAEEVEAAQKRAQELADKIRAGGNFAEIALAQSDGPTALNGGDLGWRKLNDLPSLFADLLDKAEAGHVTAPTRSPAGFHILKVYETRGGNQPQTEQQSKVRHILVKPTTILSEADAKTKIEGLRARILKGEDFAALAKENSDDPGSMLAGGDLGWSRPGMFVPQFEKMVSATDVGKVSEAFLTEHGWHILQVQERRQEDITKEVLREKAARILTNRRFEDELQVWLNELREEAYVDIKIET